MSDPCCSIGARPDAAEIDAALRAGEGLGTIAKRFPLLARSSLGVHRARCLGVAAQRAPAEVSSDPSSERPASQLDVADAGCPADRNETISQKKEASEPERDGVQKVARVRGRSEGVPASRQAGVQAIQPGVHRAVQDRPATAPSGPARSDEEHVQAIADQMADGDWVGRRSVREYANAYGLRRGQVKDFARAAALVCYADQEQIEQHRQPALGRWLKLYEEALGMADLKAAAAALTGYDRAAGVIRPPTTAVQVNVLSTPAAAPVIRALSQLLYAMCPAEADTLNAFLADVDDDRDGAKSDPLAWLERRRCAITVEPGRA